MILAHNFGPTSSPGWPGTVTRPDFSGWRNWRWLPRVATWYQPSRSTIRIASLTFGTAQASRFVSDRWFPAMPSASHDIRKQACDLLL